MSDVTVPLVYGENKVVVGEATVNPRTGQVTSAVLRAQIPEGVVSMGDFSVAEVDGEQQGPAFRSPADARGYVEELNYSIAHAEEEGLTAIQVAECRAQLRMAREYLAAFDEPV